MMGLSWRTGWRAARARRKTIRTKYLICRDSGSEEQENNRRDQAGARNLAAPQEFNNANGCAGPDICSLYVRFNRPRRSDACTPADGWVPMLENFPRGDSHRKSAPPNIPNSLGPRCRAKFLISARGRASDRPCCAARGGGLKRKNRISAPAIRSLQTHSSEGVSAFTPPEFDRCCLCFRLFIPLPRGGAMACVTS